ncbi:hypothetical protein P691DRAFT_358622 [Macrolepiota fuliginosa MF-IS2]|uniref:Uncharacterized protein n=1 Tax=Macrolepiota fuliginosa MF-IS2 TaxID=1400762 RepID=A0A9P5X3J6_9AGAR|nr:hypothetical protein P691DRAFT_358622 [Macrolepiota fuliginosa MF-IS2]
MTTAELTLRLLLARAAARSSNSLHRTTGGNSARRWLWERSDQRKRAAWPHCHLSIHYKAYVVECIIGLCYSWNGWVRCRGL